MSPLQTGPSNSVLKMITNCLVLVLIAGHALASSPKSSESNETSEPLLYLPICCPLKISNGKDDRCTKGSGNGTFSPNITLPHHMMAENVSRTFNLSVQKKRGCLSKDATLVSMSWKEMISRDTLFLKNGYLKVEKRYYHMDEYCINGKKDSNLEISVCPQDCKGPRPCIVKCCGLHQVYNLGFSPGTPKKGCHDPGLDVDYFNPALYSDLLDYTYSNSSSRLAPHFIEKYPTDFKFECHNNLTFISLHERPAEVIAEYTGVNFTVARFRIMEDGQILHQQPDGSCVTTDPFDDHMCVDGITNFGPEPIKFANLLDELVLVECGREIKKEHHKEGGLAYGVLLVISSLFLLLTIAVYVMLWERQTVHGWTILSHTVAMFLMYVTLGASHIVRVAVGHDSLNTRYCIALGIVCHFCFLATFSWLSMISLDLWLTFRAMTPRRGGTKSKGYKRYTLYTVLGLGIPATILGFGLSVGKDPEEGCVKFPPPGYGIENCYLQEKAAGLYLYYPIAFMMGINILFFLLTSIKLYVYQNSTKMATKDDSQQQFYRLFIKLFFVMGILYVFEVISGTVSGPGVFWYWMFFDLLNILRPIAVFIIFVCKSDILWALEQNYAWLKPVLIPCAFITRKRRAFSQRRADSESIGLNSTMITKQSTIRSSGRASSRLD